MEDVLKNSIDANELLSSLPYLVIMDYVFGFWKALRRSHIKKKVLSITMTRRVFTTGAHIGPSVGLLGASNAGCDGTTVVILFCFTMASMGFFYPGMKLNSMDLSPNYSGTIMAIINVKLKNPFMEKPSNYISRRTPVAITEDCSWLCWLQTRPHRRNRIHDLIASTFTISIFLHF